MILFLHQIFTTPQNIISNISTYGLLEQIRSKIIGEANLENNLLEGMR
jgi:hypothetical protein